MTPFLVHHFLERSADRTPSHPFLIQEGESATYGDIECGANRFAHFLLREGMHPGDRVGLLCNNSPVYVEAYYGILKAGCVAVPLNTAADGEGLMGTIEDCQARALIVGPRFERPVSQAIGKLPELEMLVMPDPGRLKTIPAHIRSARLEEIGAIEDCSRPDLPLTDRGNAAIIYTSGSTGKPRGATLTHLNICTNTRSIVSYLGLDESDRVLQVLPFYYVYGQSLLNTHAACGGTVVIENRFLFPNTALDTLENERCTGFSGVPSTFSILLNRSNFAERKLEHLRYITQAGGAMSPEHTRRLMGLLSGRKIFVMYGATEASARLSYVPPEQLAAKVGSIGIAIPNVELRVLRDDGSEAAVGEEGELVAQGSNIMSGYWGDAEETALVLGPEGYRTGDLGRRDEDGYFFVVGRKKDMIKAGAHRISAKEIEHAVLEYPQVHEVAAIGIPDELLGEKIRIYVVMLDGDSGEKAGLTKFLKQRLPPYKVPASIEFVNDLPKNESGKVMKQVLIKEAAATMSAGDAEV